MQRLACPHCGFRNLPSRNFCNRCELAVHESTPTAAFAEAKLPPAEQPLPHQAEGVTQVHRWAHHHAEKPKQVGGAADLPFTARPTAPWPQGQITPSPSNVTLADLPVDKTKPQGQALPSPSDVTLADLSVDKTRPHVRAPSASVQPAMQAIRPPGQPQFASATAQEGVTVAARSAKLSRAKTLQTQPDEPAQWQRPAAHAPATSAVLGARVPGSQGHSSAIEQPLLTRPSGRRVALALLIDTGLIVAVLVALSTLQMLLSAHAAWPVGRPTAFEALAMWLYEAHSAARLALLTTTALGLIYCILAAKVGGSLGQRTAGLRLVDTYGNLPGWDAAMWHALGALMGVAVMGAGYIWPLLDRRKRSWASLVSRTELVVLS